MSESRPSTRSTNPTVQNSLRLLSEHNGNPRADVLLEAATCVLQDRNTSYGEPEDNFQNIADLWNTRLQIRLRTLGLRLVDGEGQPVIAGLLKAHDVAIWMIDVKTTRIEHSPEQRDHWSDINGYGACGYQAAINKK